MVRLSLELDLTTIEKLKQRAQQHGQSLEEESKAILAAAVEPASVSQKTLSEVRQRLFKVRQKYQGRMFGDSTKLLREDRQS